MTSKKILLLGGSAQQIVAIRAAKELGLYTVLCDYLPDNPGQHEADKFYQVSTTDIDAVYRVAKKENVSGILAYASDPAALPAAIVAERLGLPTNPSKSVAILGVKHLFRDFLERNGFACPRHLNFSPSITLVELKNKIKSLTFPVVIKPTDSSGSKGITIIDNDCDGNYDDRLKGAISHALNFSRNKVLIVEEFIERGFPDVIGGDVFVVDGKIQLFGEMSCLRDFHGEGLIPLGERWPSGLNMKQKRCLHDELRRIIEVLGIRFGELNMEVILNKEGRPCFLELGPRAGGNMIPLQLGDAFNVDLVKANVLVAMGENPNLDLHPRTDCLMHYVLHSYQAGKFGGIEYSPDIKLAIYRKCYYKNTGDVVESFDGAGKALGIVFLRFDNENQMYDFCENKDKLIKPIVV